MVIERTGVGSGGGVDVMLDEISVGSSCSAGKKVFFVRFFLTLMNTLRHKICYFMSAGSWVLSNLYPPNVGLKDVYVLRIKKKMKINFQNKSILIKCRLDKKFIIHRVFNIFALL